MIAVRTIEVDSTGGESITVSAPYFTASFSFFTSSAASDALGENDVRVHLALAGDADRHRLKVGVIDVGR